MENPDQQKLFELIGKSQRILIALPANPNGDTLGGSLALAAFLRKLNKEVEVYCEKTDFGTLSFLPGIQEVHHEIVFPKSFVISVKTKNAKLDELSYDMLPENVNIYLKPKEGIFTPEDVSFSNDVTRFNLIICVDVASLESLGALYEKNAEMFFAVPKVNIDNHIHNDNYGTINIVDVTASSSSEILLALLRDYEASLIDESIATNLLTGIITETNSFQHNKTTPNSFINASELISYGAKQQEIVKNLFKTKELPVLKLWGRAMARIQSMPEYDTIFSVVGISDIEKSEAGEGEIFQVAQDFMVNINDAKMVFFVAERSEYLEMYVASNPNIKLKELVNYLGGSFVADGLGKIIIKDKQITEVDQFIKETLSDLKTRLGI
ncbi:MAG: DHH family phosphoesterase [Candidatus Doudnabacteria bacterium]